MKNKLKKAFTLTELVIVIAVIAILAAVLIPTFSNVIESSKKSASLQTCHNALVEVNVQATTNGEDASGTVFVSDGYAYVYFNGALNYIGKTKDLDRIGSDGTYTKGKAGLAENLDFNGTTSIKFATSEGTLMELEYEALEANIEKTAENLYIYKININNTDYLGAFTMEEAGENSLRYVEGATYSRSACVSSYEVNIIVS